jgi:hypothetical protein
MPQPTSADVLFSEPLQNMSVAYMQDNPNDFVADKVFPNIEVDIQAGVYLTYDREAWLRDEAKRRAPGTASEGSGYKVDFNSKYYCEPYAFHKDIDAQIRANSRKWMDMDRDATAFVTRKLLIKRDVIWAGAYFISGVWGLDILGVASGPSTNQVLAWNKANSTPIEDIQLQLTRIAQQTGFTPNTLVLTPDVFNALRNHAEIIYRIVYTQRGVVTAEILASLIGVDRILIPSGIKNSAAEGEAASYGFILGSGKALLVYAAPAPGLLTVSGGYTFSWVGYLGASSAGTAMSSWFIPELKSTRVEGEIAFDCKVVAADLGVLFSGLVQ